MSTSLSDNVNTTSDTASQDIVVETTSDTVSKDIVETTNLETSDTASQDIVAVETTSDTARTQPTKKVSVSIAGILSQQHPMKQDVILLRRMGLSSLILFKMMI